jgi:NADPH:quinone reductase-like Zn-dependent oxidoreductase
MKAIVQDRFGPPDVLELRDVPDPVVGENDVLVQVRAAGCGPDVWHIMAGKPYLIRLMPEMRKLMRGIRGWDVAGQVEAVGANVREFRPGDEVMGAVDGSFAELAIGTEETLVRKPAGISLEQAAAVPVSGYTALQALRKADVQPGQSVLVSEPPAGSERSPCRSRRPSAPRSPASAAGRRPTWSAPSAPTT